MVSLRINLFTIVISLVAGISIFAQNPQEITKYTCANQYQVNYTGYEWAKGPVESINIERDSFFVQGDVVLAKRGKPYVFATYKFNGSGRLTEQNYYRTDGVPLPKSTFIYDLQGRLVKEQDYSATTNEPYLETIYHYENDFLKELIARNIKEGGFLSKKTFSYIPEKHYFEFVETKSYKSPVMRVGFTQDDKCRFSEVFLFAPDEKVATKTIVSFDSFDNPIAMIAYSSMGSEIAKRKLEYKYDSQQNWIERSDFRWKDKEGKEQWVLEEINYRKIKYFSEKK